MILCFFYVKIYDMKRYYTYQIKKTVSVVDLKTVEKLTLTKGYSYPEEKHTFYEFIYVKKGNVFCKIDGEKFTLNGGDFRVISPSKTHHYFTENPAEIFIVCFQSKSGILEILSNTISLNEYMRSLVEKIMVEAENSFIFPFTERLIPKEDAIFGSQQLIEILIEELLIGVLRQTLEDSKVKLVKNTSELKNNIVSDTVSYLNKNLYGNLTLDKVCKKTLYSSTYLNKLFKEKKGCTVMKYYQNLKISEAKSLLKKGLSVSEVSDELYFTDVNYFCKVFKKATGRSPLKYKKQYES